MRILLVEDDQMLGRAICDGLSMHFAVDLVKTVQNADLALKTTPYDLIILDLGLPDGSGFDVLQSVRTQSLPTPIIILTARDGVRHKIDSLNSGADDYVIKPFDLDELIARCNALLRRANRQVAGLQTWGNISFDPVARTVCVDNKPVKLSAKELSIFTILMNNRGRIVTKSQIEDSIYNWSHEIESNTIEVHISSLRRKLHRDMIQTLRGMGYRIATSP